jgi:protein-disulfide isomerase
VAVLVALVIVVVVQSQRTDSSADADAPANTVADATAVRVGADDAPVTVTVYEDFLCPACKSRPVPPASAWRPGSGTGSSRTGPAR